jgi:hypothetical protein
LPNIIIRKTYSRNLVLLFFLVGTRTRCGEGESLFGFDVGHGNWGGICLRSHTLPDVGRRGMVTGDGRVLPAIPHTALSIPYEARHTKARIGDGGKTKSKWSPASGRPTSRICAEANWGWARIACDPTHCPLYSLPSTSHQTKTGVRQNQNGLQRAGARHLEFVPRQQRGRDRWRDRSHARVPRVHESRSGTGIGSRWSSDGPSGHR